jgi:uncharacterized protein (DUF2237 family)
VFPGLQPGDRWGLCAGRWFEGFRAKVAPPVYLEATNEAALKIVPLNILEPFSVTANGREEL